MKASTLRNICLIASLVLMTSAMSTSDYYVLELHQSEPAHVWYMLGIGIVLALPTAFHIMLEARKRGR